MLAEQLRSKGKKIVSTNGCFDLLHWGHIQYLWQARKLGDVLICGVNSDASVKGLKGDSRPIQTESIRVKQIAALEPVDFAFVFDEDTPEDFLKDLHSNIHVKGGDYKGKDIPEKRVVESWGGELVFVDLVPGFSTTLLIEKLKRS